MFEGQRSYREKRKRQDDRKLTMFGFTDGCLETDFNSHTKFDLFESCCGPLDPEGFKALRDEIRSAEEQYCANSMDLETQFNRDIRVSILDDITTNTMKPKTTREEREEIDSLVSICDDLREKCSISAKLSSDKAEATSETRKAALEHIKQTAKSISRMKRRIEVSGSKVVLPGSSDGRAAATLVTKGASPSLDWCESEATGEPMLKKLKAMSFNPTNVLKSPEAYLLNSKLGGNRRARRSARCFADFLAGFMSSEGLGNKDKPGYRQKKKGSREQRQREFERSLRRSLEANTKESGAGESQVEGGEEVGSSEETTLDSDAMEEEYEEIDLGPKLRNSIYRTEDGKDRWPTLEEISKIKSRDSFFDSPIEVENQRAGEEVRIEDDPEDNLFGDEEDDDSDMDQDEAARVIALEAGTLDTNLLTGDERLEMFRQVLDLFQLEREDNQIDFHEVMIQTVLPKIFTDEWETDYERIKRMFDIEEHHAETFIICPRRYGKTVSVAMFCAAYIFMIPNATVAIFSTSKRTAGKMMAAIYTFMRDLPFFRHVTFNVKNSECIEIVLNGNKREMWCYPGTVAVCFCDCYCSLV